MQPTSICLLALDKTGPLAIAARAQAGDAIGRLAANTNGFRFANVTDLQSPNFLPGGARYHDLPGMLAVAAPGKLWIAGEGNDMDSLVTAAYRAAGNRDAIVRDDESRPAASLTGWLLSSPE